MTPEEKARKAVDDILKDICDRSGLQNAWEEIDEDIQEEIKEEWVDVILEAMKT